MSKLIYKEDAETLAMRRIVGVLEPLSTNARARVLKWAIEKSAELPEAQPGPPPAQVALFPSAVQAPAPEVSQETRDRINKELAEASAKLAGGPAGAQLGIAG